jgi:hypothetical protein
MIDTTSKVGRRRLRWPDVAAMMLLAGYLVFAHGCHGDEDNELLALAARKDGLSRTGSFFQRRLEVWHFHRHRPGVQLHGRVRQPLQLQTAELPLHL